MRYLAAITLLLIGSLLANAQPSDKNKQPQEKKCTLANVLGKDLPAECQPPIILVPVPSGNGPALPPATPTTQPPTSPPTQIPSPSAQPPVIPPSQTPAVPPTNPPSQPPAGPLTPPSLVPPSSSPPGSSPGASPPTSPAASPPTSSPPPAFVAPPPPEEPICILAGLYSIGETQLVGNSQAGSPVTLQECPTDSFATRAVVYSQLADPDTVQGTVPVLVTGVELTCNDLQSTVIAIRASPGGATVTTLETQGFRSASANTQTVQFTFSGTREVVANLGIGSAGGTYSTVFNIPEDSVIIGVQGRISSYLEQIGFEYATCNSGAIIIGPD